MGARGAAGGGGGGRAGGGAAPGAARAWADLPPELLEAVARAVPAGDRLWFRLVCRSWAAAGARVAPAEGERPLRQGKVTRTRMADLYGLYGETYTAYTARLVPQMLARGEPTS